MHVTNYSVNKHQPGFVANTDADYDGVGSKWSLRALQEHLESQCGVQWHKIWTQVHRRLQAKLMHMIIVIVIVIVVITIIIIVIIIIITMMIYIQVLKAQGFDNGRRKCESKAVLQTAYERSVCMFAIGAR